MDAAVTPHRPEIRLSRALRLYTVGFGVFWC